MAISNASVAQLFTITAQDWTSINTLVGFELYANTLSSCSGGAFNLPPDDFPIAQLNNLAASAGGTDGMLCIPLRLTTQNASFGWNIRPNIGNLLPSAQAWTHTTFNSIIILSLRLNTYASQAIHTFSQLNTLIAQSGSSVTSDLQTATVNAVQQLSSGTQELATLTTTVFNTINSFLAAQQDFVNFMNSNSFLIPLINLPELNADLLANFNSSIGKVTGAWNALSNDLSAMVNQPIVVTLPFLESLNIEAAMKDWNNILNETQNFSTFAGGQSKYWLYTTSGA